MTTHNSYNFSRFCKLTTSSAPSAYRRANVLSWGSTVIQHGERKLPQRYISGFPSRRMTPRERMYVSLLHPKNPSSSSTTASTHLHHLRLPDALFGYDGACMVLIEAGLFLATESVSWPSSSLISGELLHFGLNDQYFYPEYYFLGAFVPLFGSSIWFALVTYLGLKAAMLPRPDTQLSSWIHTVEECCALYDLQKCPLYSSVL
jgi:hypothetical protein